MLFYPRSGTFFFSGSVSCHSREWPTPLLLAIAGFPAVSKHPRYQCEKGMASYTLHPPKKKSPRNAFLSVRYRVTRARVWYGMIAQTPSVVNNWGYDIAIPWPQTEHLWH